MGLIDSYRLDDRDEAIFRSERLPRDSQQASILVALVAVPMVGFAGADPHFLEGGRALASFLALRAALVIASILTVWWIRRNGNVGAFDRVLTAWSWAIVLFALATSASRPPEYLPVYVISALMVLGAYVALPARLSTQVCLAMGLSLGEAALWIFYKQPQVTVPAQVALVTAFGFANIIGFVVSRQLHHFRRLEFALGRRERQLVGELERALSEVAALEGKGSNGLRAEDGPTDG